jgi:class 3 adenylate cyclase
MNRETRYCTSADGTRIAFTVFGEPGGTPSVSVSPWVNTTETVLQIPYLRAWPESLSARSLHIAYDRRGTGASQREIVECSLQRNLEDLAAVVESARLNTFNLLGLAAEGAVVAAAYAAEHPERVERLVLGTFGASGRQVWGADAQSIINMIADNWPLAARTLGELMWALSSPGTRREQVRILRRSCSPDAAALHVRFWSTYDIRAILPRLSSPTLVTLIPAGPRSMAGSRDTAAMIPDVRVVEVEGDTEEEYVLSQLHHTLRFLGVGREATGAPETSGSAATAIVLFTDIVDSTALTERLGDTVFRTASRALDEGMRAAMRDAGGTPVEGKVLGDGVMGVFTSASQAIAAARRCVELSAASELQLHVGLHAGDVIHESGNVYGGAVNIASRVCGLSAPGEVLVSRTVADLARTSAGVTFEDRGEHALKGIDDAVRVYEVRWRE